MTISFQTFRSINIGLVVILLFTAFLGFTLFLPNEPVKAGLPVADILGTAAQWVIHALEKVGQIAWDGIKFVAQKSWDVLKQSWEWIRENAIATLVAAAAKIAAKWLLEQAQKLVDSRRIESYLYYADFLIRNVYALEYITKHYDGDRENQMILMTLISEGDILKNRLDPLSPAYQAIRNKTLLNSKCQTYNLSPASPDYYIRLLEIKGPECTPSFVVAAYRDAALTAVGESRDAALEEIRSGQGYKASRPCGTVVTRPGELRDPLAEAQALENERAAKDGVPPIKIGVVGGDQLLGSDGQSSVSLPPVQTPDPGEVIDVLPTVASAICGFVTNPAGLISTQINSMIDQVVNIISDPNKEHQDSAGLRSYLSDTLANIGYRLLQGRDSESVPRFDGLGNPRLASGKLSEDYDFLNEVPPGIDANRREGDINLGSLDISGRDEQRLRDYWNDMCNSRLPLMFALLAGNHPTEYQEVQLNSLRNDSRIDTNPHSFKFFGTQGWNNPPNNNTYEVIRNRLDNMTSVEEVIRTPIPFFVHRPQAGQTADDWVRYDYLWQILDPVGHIDQTTMPFGATQDMDQWHSLGRQYFMGLGGFPTADDIENARNWVPNITSGWPYFVDKNGKGYVWGEGPTSKEGYTQIGQGRLYLVANSVTQELARTFTMVYETAEGELIYAADADLSDGGVVLELWKLDTNVSVNIRDGQVITNQDNFKLDSASQSHFVEFNHNGVVKVLAAERLEQQAPCKAEPFGPPANLKDLQKKVFNTRAISQVGGQNPLGDLWEWSFSYHFAKDGANQF